MTMGIFITFEGIEGSGKTTQIDLLKEYLLEKNYRVEITREPGGTSIGKQIRRILLDNNNKKISGETELLLSLADRVQHLQEVILPALKEDKIVLCDRFSDSTLAYQGYGRKIDLGLIENLHQTVLGEIKPDLTILLDIDISKGLKRAETRNLQRKESEREERFEKEKLEFHQRVRNGYLELAKKNRERIKIINGKRKREDIQKEIRGYTEEILREG